MIRSAPQARHRPTALRPGIQRRIPFGGAYLCGLLRSRNDRLRRSTWRRPIAPTGTELLNDGFGKYVAAYTGRHA